MTLNRNLAVTDMFISAYSWGGDVTKVINSNICCIATEGQYHVLREITATKLIELGFVRVIVLPPLALQVKNTNSKLLNKFCSIIFIKLPF